MKLKPILFSTPMVQAILDGRKTQTRRVIGDRPTEKLYFDDLAFRQCEWFKDDETVNYGCTHPDCEEESIDNEGNPIGKCFHWACHHPLLLDYKDEEGVNSGDTEITVVKPKYQIGDILYVKETFSVLHGEGTSPLTSDVIAYKADNNEASKLLTKHKAWKPSLFMPQAYARIFLKVTNVRVERLQDISEEDAIAEGIKEIPIVLGGLCHSKGYQDYENPRYKNDAFISAIDSYKSLWNSINKKEPEKQWDTNPYVFVYEFERVEKPEVMA